MVSGIRLFSIAVDPAGNLYVTAYSNSPNDGTYNLIKIPVGGGPQTILAKGLGAESGLATDVAGNIYIADGISAILEIRSGTGAPVVIASGFNNPTGITVDGAGNLYIAEGQLNRIEKIRITGGYYVSPSLPKGLMLNSATGVISGESIPPSPATNYKVTAYNSSGSASALVNIQVNTPPPPTITYGGPHVYTKNTAITPLTPASTNVAVYAYHNSTQVLAGGFDASVTADATGNVYMDFGNSVKKIPAGGRPAVVVASGFNHSEGFAVDKAGNVYVSDVDTKSIMKFPAAGGSPVTVGSGTGSIAVDNAGNIYAANGNAVSEILIGGGPNHIVASGFNGMGGIAVDTQQAMYSWPI